VKDSYGSATLTLGRTLLFLATVSPCHELKVPKCEIFDRSDFHNFYTIKSLWEGDFGDQIC
jgi:hypothetical protein